MLEGYSSFCFADLLNCANIFKLILMSKIKVLQQDYKALKTNEVQHLRKIENLDNYIKKQGKLLSSKEEENISLEKVLREQQIIIKLALNRIFPTPGALKICPVRF